MDICVTNLINSINRLRNFSISREDLRSVKDALNGVLGPDIKCSNFTYTVNLDKLPFGCIVFPILSSDMIDRLMIMGESTKIQEYDIELDSKVFDYGLTDEQVASIMIFNAYHMTKDRRPCENVREAVDDFFVREGKILVIRDSVQYRSILDLGLVDALSQITSCLNLPDEVQSDAFLDSLELFELKDALHKLYREIPGCENEVRRQPKLSVLNWCLRLYDNVAMERIPALRLLEKVKEITASTLYHNKFNAVIVALNKIETDKVVTEAVKRVFSEAKQKSGWFGNLKYAGLRDIENDLYFYQVKINNTEDENEILYNLKQINARLALLDDYIRENSENEDPEMKRWIRLRDQYLEVRDTLAKKKLHNKPYGIFVDYDQLDYMYDKYSK